MKNYGTIKECHNIFSIIENIYIYKSIHIHDFHGKTTFLKNKQTIKKKYEKLSDK